MKAKEQVTFTITPAQEQTIAQRAIENGFDDIASYVKVVALKTQAFSLTQAGLSNEAHTIKISFEVDEAQKQIIETNAKESGCEELETYLRYVSLHGVVNAVVEVRSTGTLDAMLERIAQSRNLKKPKRLF